MTMSEYDKADEMDARAQAQAQADLDTYPEQPWLDPEERTLVSYNDVKDPEVASFWRYGTGHAVIIPGAHD